MIYLVSKSQSLFNSELYKRITIEDSLDMMKDWNMIQYDSETSGRDARLCDILCMQFGDLKGENQVVVDTTTISPLKYKELLENKFLIGQNLKFDLQFLYNYKIIPRKLYDTMIVEQLLHLGYPSGIVSYSLKEIAYRRLNVDIDKTVRGEIIWRGLDDSVIKYAAGDVMYLGDIMKSQLEDCKKQDLMRAAKLECDFIPSIAYLEWCGIHLDQDKWKAKMAKDKENLTKAKENLDKFLVKLVEDNNIQEGRDIYEDSDWGTKFKVYEELRDFVVIDRQGNLFTGFDLTPKCTINWLSSKQVCVVARTLGFDTQVKDKKTGEDKDSALEKHLKTQKGVNDEFLKLYFDYREYAKVVSSFGQGHLNAINPKTNRIHTVFRQLSTSSGRLSCGSNQPNTDLAKYKGISPNECKYPK